MGSIAILIAFYSICGIILLSTFPSTSIQGLELASMMKGFSLSSSMKSRPNISNEYSFILGFSLLAVDTINCVAISFIL